MNKQWIYIVQSHSMFIVYHRPFTPELLADHYWTTDANDHFHHYLCQSEKRFVFVEVYVFNSLTTDKELAPAEATIDC